MTDDLDRLRLLHVVSRTGSIAAAAREVGFTPSAVSQQMAALERRVGVTLLERTNRGVLMTPAGTSLCAQGVMMLDLFDAGVAEAVHVARAAPATPIRIAAFPTAITALLSPALGGLDVAVTIVHLEPGAALVALLDRTVDLAVVDHYDIQPDPLPPGVDHDRLGRDALRLVAARRHRHAALSDLSDVGWVLGSPASRLGRVSRMLCHRSGFEPRVIAETDDHHLAFAIASSSGAATLQPELAAGDLRDGGPLDLAEIDLGVVRTIDLVRRHLPRPDPFLATVTRALLG